jgi:hypothetical protein
MSVLKTLTEGIEPRDLYKESSALLQKWERTGLLEGLNSDDHRNQMARLLENQAKELLRESSAMAGGDVEGFAAVAFPLVRRVFASLVAQDLVSVQPMSLPSGLIFFLDFTFSGDAGMDPNGTRLGYQASGSIYGQGRVASQITGGVILTGVEAERGPYALNSGYTSPTGTITVGAFTCIASGTIGDGGAFDSSQGGLAGTTTAEDINQILRFDPDLVSGSAVAVGTVSAANLLNSQFNQDNLVALTWTGSATDTTQVRRLTRLATAGGAEFLQVVFATTTASAAKSTDAAALGALVAGVSELDGPLDDNFANGGALGSVVGSAEWGLEGEPNIPEIDIKVDSVPVTAMTKKLKAKWTPELGQDLNAYHNMDAEVELTSILSEQVALEIDREILEDLVKGATAGTYYWSRRPGKFVNRTTGADIAGGTQNEALLGADFTGNVSEWYETLIETINDVSAQIHRKTLRGGANFIVVSPEMANILEFTSGFRASVTHDDDRGTVGAVKVGSISKKFDVYVDPYFLRNVVLVGRRGASFLESGYVYAPYVPLQVTPTIFGVEDFVPRKGVMTRYAKKMVRPDMYGLVVCKDFLG